MLQARRADIDLKDVLRDGNSGRVHSRYRSTTNLVDGEGNWWAVVNPRVEAAPRALSLCAPIDHSAGTGDVWRIEDRALCMGAFHIALNGIQYAGLKVSTAPVSQRAVDSTAQLCAAMPAKPTDPFAQHADGLARHRFETDLLRCTSTASLQAAVTSLIGLGSGLTPIGDDLISGLLLASATPHTTWHRRRCTLVDAVTQQLHQTHPISANYLRDACQAKAPSCVGELRRNLSNPSTTLTTNLKQVWDLGSSSGPALVAGLLAGLKH